MSQATAGQVEIVANGSTYLLKPTLAALQRIDQRFGGVVHAARACGELSFAGITFIIEVGANLNKLEADKMKEDVFQEGLSYLSSKAALFIGSLMNPSGKQRDPEPDEKN